MIIKPYQMERRSSHDSNQLPTFFLENIVVPILLRTEESINKNGLKIYQFDYQQTIVKLLSLNSILISEKNIQVFKRQVPIVHIFGR